MIRMLRKGLLLLAAAVLTLAGTFGCWNSKKTEKVAAPSKTDTVQQKEAWGEATIDGIRKGATTEPGVEP